jgi:hypothetical protein
VEVGDNENTPAYYSKLYVYDGNGKITRKNVFVIDILNEKNLDF